ncbi:DNA-binding response regulator [Flavobacteriaceae bacterium AU392]|nr:DNA-binding response regulator [Flavobacteriaceae bacterium]RKM84076.1 DNA-binding response regulator [Flavobacteriaceae bacterium AU392]
MKKTIFVFGGLVLGVAILFQLSRYSIDSGNLKIEIAIAVIALVFFFIGVYINKKSLHKELKPSSEIDYKKIEALEITKREYEVLKEIALGLSNKEIGEKLFLSESTIKSHVSNLLLKLDAKRRTQAIQIAKSLQII